MQINYLDLWKTAEERQTRFNTSAGKLPYQKVGVLLEELIVEVEDKLRDTTPVFSNSVLFGVGQDNPLYSRTF